MGENLISFPFCQNNFGAPRIHSLGFQYGTCLDLFLINAHHPLKSYGIVPNPIKARNSISSRSTFNLLSPLAINFATLYLINFARVSNVLWCYFLCCEGEHFAPGNRWHSVWQNLRHSAGRIQSRRDQSGSQAELGHSLPPRLLGQPIPSDCFGHLQRHEK